MSEMAQTSHDRLPVKKRSRMSKLLSSKKLQRGATAILIFLLLWEIGSRWEGWFGYPLPWIGLIPAPTAVAAAAAEVVTKVGYWLSWVDSFKRVMIGFHCRQLLGIPFGLALAVNKYFRGIFFPPFEILRPIPPLAWVPASLIFWPTNEMSIAFVTFLGRILHRRHQRARRRQSHRCALLAGSSVHGRQPMGSVLQDHPARHIAIHLHRRCRWNGHHLGSGSGG